VSDAIVEPNLSAKGPIIVGCLACIVLLLGPMLWASQVTISGAIVTVGLVEIAETKQVIQHPVGGVVSRILVQNGDTVLAGDALVELDGTQALSELSILKNQFHELLARRARLEAERDGTDTLTFDPRILKARQTDENAADIMDGQILLFQNRAASQRTERQQLENQKQQIDAQIEGLTAQLAALERQKAIAADETTSQRSLAARGLVSAAKLNTLEKEMAQLDGAIGQTISGIAEMRQRTIAVDLQLTREKSQRREMANDLLRDLQYLEFEIEERIAAIAKQIRTMTIQSPVSGIVHDLRLAGPGVVARPAEDLLFIIPNHSQNRITAHIDPSQISEIYVGQSVGVKPSDVSRQAQDEVIGLVTHISADTLRDPQTRKPYFQIQVELLSGQKTQIADLLPGMPVQLFIRTLDRSPLDYVLAPLDQYFDRVFRDG